MIVIVHYIVYDWDEYVPYIPRFSCTYLWLAQYFLYVKDVKYMSNYASERLKNWIIEAVNKNEPRCEFDKLIFLCNRNHFVWDMSDTKLLSKSIQIVLNISLYFISLFGIVTNLIVVNVIWNKKTKEIFKDLKHYPYLAAISVYNVIILVIQILSWISDCKDTLDLFCPSIRKYIAIQFLKVKII